VGESEDLVAPQRRVRLPMTPEAARSILRGGLSEDVTKLIQASEAEGFSGNIEAQAEAICGIRKVWTHLTSEDKDRLTAALSPKVSRCRAAAKPLNVFRRLVILPTDADVRRALACAVQPQRIWSPEDDELIYPTDGWIGAYLQYAKHNEANIGFHFWAILCAIGSVCQRKFFIDMGQFKVHLHNYVVLTGDSASGKTIAANTAMNILKRFNRAMYDIDPQSGDSVLILPDDTTAEFLVQELGSRQFVSRQGKVGPPAPGEEMIDATGMFFLDEIANFLSKDQWAVRKRIPLLTALYDTDHYVKGTRGMGREELFNVALSMLALGAPEWFKSNITEDFRQGGMLDRTLFVHRSPTHRVYTLPLDPLDPTIAEGLVADLVAWGKQRSVEMKATEDGKLWADSWYTAGRQAEIDEFYGAAAARQGLTVARSLKRHNVLMWKVAAILSLTYGEAPFISDERFEQAATLLGAEDRSLTQLLSFVDRGPDADLFDAVENYIRKRGGCCTRTQVMARFYREGKRLVAGNISRHLETLEHAGKLDKFNGSPIIYRLPGHGDCKDCRQQVRPVSRLRG
jgi:hypothetical protein